jgi:hypothetical protein
MVNGSNWRKFSVGHVGDDPRQADDGKHVAASLWIQDARTIRKIKDGDLQELSVGYSAALDETPGTSPDGEHYDAKQTEIRGNHVALLRAGQARGGRSVRLRLDSAGDVVLSNEPEETLMKFKIRADGLDFDVEAPDDNVSKALEKERIDVEKILKTAEEAKSEADARADAAEDKIQSLEKDLESFKQAELEKAVDSVKADALKIAPSLSIQDGDTPEQIRRNALDEAGIKTDGKDDTYVTVRFDMALEAPEKKEKSPVAEARRQPEIRGDSVSAFSLDMTF